MRYEMRDEVAAKDSHCWPYSDDDWRRFSYVHRRSISRLQALLINEERPMHRLGSLEKLLQYMHSPTSCTLESLETSQRVYPSATGNDWSISTYAEERIFLEFTKLLPSIQYYLEDSSSNDWLILNYQKDCGI